MEELFFGILALLVVGIALVSWLGGIGFLIFAIVLVILVFTGEVF